LFICLNNPDDTFCRIEEIEIAPTIDHTLIIGKLVGVAEKLTADVFSIWCRTKKGGIGQKSITKALMGVIACEAPGEWVL